MLMPYVGCFNYFATERSVTPHIFAHILLELMVHLPETQIVVLSQAMKARRQRGEIVEFRWRYGNKGYKIPSDSDYGDCDSSFRLSSGQND
jgi:hypothetical protein